MHYYSYAIATDSGMENIVLANTTNTTGFTTNLNALSTGEYYWMVQVEDKL
ncbi:MAG: hypothetical protein GXP45_05230 [bacterium]|nr:hypothetical protein [bacterium]